MIEIVVALAIFSFMAGGLLTLASAAIRQTSQAEASTNAGLLAQSLLAKIGTEILLRNGHISERSDHEMRWNIHIEPYGDATDRRQWPVSAYKLSIEIFWNDGTQERSLRLSTLRIGPKERAP